MKTTMKKCAATNEQDCQATCTLKDCKPGETRSISNVVGENKTLTSKLLSMGFVAGTQVTVLSKAPLGDPIKVKTLGYTLSLRCSEAECVKML